ncbi:MAG TPA: von Willebrand factor type A domain-containing protein [Candidatus Acidoferrales bacterium]|jgi:Mg-chelatase subunit ChlD/capsular polysaccharide biosynthesis protein|nr:von Willebrand factor type A domain-containing protein [Candidatus Acidoferrales bacterium]
MNPDNPSREDIELRITMLLLGELSAAEAEALRQTISQDAALKKLHDELQTTIGLVREVEKSPVDNASDNSTALKLSDERRQKLLAHFQTPRPQESFWIRPLKIPSLVPVLVVVAIVALLAAMLLPVLSGSRDRSASSVGQQDVLGEQESITYSLKKVKKAELASASPPAATPAPAVVTAAPEPVLAPPPAPPIVLPPTEAPAAVTTGSLADSGTGGVYSQNIVGYVNVPQDAKTLTVTPAAPAVTYGLKNANPGQATAVLGRMFTDQNKSYNGLNNAALESEAKPVAVIDPSTGLPVQQSVASVDRPATGNNSGAIIGMANAFGGAGGLRNTGSGGGGGGGGGGAFQGNISGTLTGYYDDGSSKTGKDAETKLALDDSAANRSRTENGPASWGAEMRPAAPPTYDTSTLAAAPAPDSSPALTVHDFVSNDFESMQREGAEKKFGASEITKGASQLHGTEPAFQNKLGFYKVTPLPGARTAVGAIENDGEPLALNTAPAETPPTSDTGVAQMQATDNKSAITDVNFAQAAGASNDSDNNGLAGKKSERNPARQRVNGNGVIEDFTTPPSATAVPLLGDIPAAGSLFASGTGEAGANRADKSGRGEPTLNGNNSFTGGTTYGERNMTLGVTKDSFQTGLAKDDVAGLRYSVTTNSVALALNGNNPAAGGTTFAAGKPATDTLDALPGGSYKEQQRLPGISAAAADDAEYEHQLVDAERQRELRATKSGSNTNGFFNVLSSDDETKTKVPPALAETDHQSYEIEKRKLQDLEETLKLLNLKITANSIDAKIPTTTMVQITDAAQPNSNQTFWQSLRGEYASTAKIKVENDGGIITGFSQAAATAQPYDPYFIQTTFEVMQSSAVLGKVVDDLHLDTAWADKNGGQKLSKQRAIELLKSRLSLQPVRNTKLVAISMTSDKPEEAAKLANAVALAYQNYRVANNQQTAAKGLEVLQEQYLAESNQIVQIQSNLAQMEPKSVESITEADVPVRRPPANAPVPQPEILTSANAFSTFSLNVSDVSFKLAEASLEKGQMPDAANIRSEEFINAFDYRDPEAAAGQPMAFASERARYPFAHNRELLRFSIKTAAAGRPAGRALNLVLLLDNSGSMERADRVAIIREALRVLAGQLQPQDTVSVVTFARTARLWADGVAGDKAGETLAQVGDITPEGGTNLEEAMRLAYETAHRHYLANGLNRVVLLTDGAANLGNVDPAMLKQKVEAQRKQGIALDCFGIGFEGYDDDLLEQLSRNGDGRYAFINSPEDAGSEFAAKLAGALQIAASDVKVQVEFNPQRVISYRQIGYAKHQLTKEQFRDNTVDAAEIAAQEAGNALYTVETKLDGTGPVAAVHVRYKVPGTTDYQEHSWDVAYEGNVPALEQASAAMRLAGTASAFSEWLAVSPFAQEVTPDELLKVISGVPEIYGADERPKKLEWMIRQAKSLSGK